MRPSARMRQRMPLLCNPIPVYDPAAEKVKADAAKLRASLSRYETKHGVDALISLLKIELLIRGEKRTILDSLAPHPGQRGQRSLLDTLR